MNGPHTRRHDPTDDAIAAPGPCPCPNADRSLPWQARLELERYRADTERLRVLVEFLSRPIHAPGGSDPDPDILTAYNLAVEAALHGIRHAASAARTPPA
jgi:hypothetical protein